MPPAGSEASHHLCHLQEQLGRVAIRRKPVFPLLSNLPPLPLPLFTFTLTCENSLKKKQSNNNLPKKSQIHHINDIIKLKSKGDLFTLLSQPSGLPLPSASLLPPAQVPICINQVVPNLPRYF